MVLLDLDRFKEVNDTLGHHIGDALLRSIADIVARALPADAAVARLGGDEFAAVLPGVHDADEALAIATHLAQAIAVPVTLPDTVLSVHASVGVTVSAPGHDASDLLRQADTAMYAAKDTGVGVTVYTPDLDRGRAERLALLGDLHVAIAEHRLTVAYQPKLDLVTGHVSGVEALVRWDHPTLGPISPEVFVTLAEANGLIGQLTQHVLFEALRQCADWAADGLRMSVAVNLSAQIVSNSLLPELIRTALQTADVPAVDLVLEITESSVMADPDRAVPVLERIAATGVTLSLDDFGTGYSSLAYLRRLPVGEVKIDRSFITGMVDDDDASQVLVRAIINLAASLGLRVVAEGAEDDQTVELLRAMGCDTVQGFAVSRPVSAAGITEFVRSRPVGSKTALRLVV